MKKTQESGKRKETTIDDLAVMVAKGFSEVNTTIDKNIGEVNDRIGNLENRMGTFENRMGTLEDNLSATRMSVLEIGDRFVPRYEFNNLLTRFDRLEQKVKGK